MTEGGFIILLKKRQPTFADCRKSKIVNLLCLQGFLPVKTKVANMKGQKQI